jgi:nucleoside-diphosphate-sugar epimerase
MLVERLAARKEVERIVAIDVAGLKKMPEKVETAEMDVRDPGIARCFQGCDIVVHLAFIVAAIHDLAKTYDINLNGTRNVLAACETAGIEKLVAASSVAAYGRQPRDNRLINEDTPLRGESSSYYLHTKRLVEELLDLFEKRNPGVIVTRLRPSILIGPRNDNFAQEIGKLKFSLRVKEGAFLPVVHEEDVIDAFELAVDRDAPGAFIISLPEPISLQEFSGGPRRFKLSLSLDTMMKICRAGYALHLTLLSPDWVISADANWRFDLTRSREVLGWSPKHDAQSSVAAMLENIQNKRRRKRTTEKT